VLIYDAEPLSPLPEQARLDLAALAETRSAAQARQKHLKALTDRGSNTADGAQPSPYTVYARALLAASQNGRYDRAIKRVQQLRQQQTLDPALAKRIEARLQRWRTRQ
jgi:hypothetical protein